MESVTFTEVVLDEKKTEVFIRELRICDNQLYTYLISLDDEDSRRNFIERAIRVGSMVLQMMDATSRVDYVRSEFSTMKDEFCKNLEKYLAEDGTLSLKLQDFFGEKGELQQAFETHFGPQGSVIYKILNPNDETTPLGKFMKKLEQELDANKEGTAFYDLKKCFEDRFAQLSKDIGIVEARAEEREKSTRKGIDFQEKIYKALDKVARSFEDKVEFVANEPGPIGRVGDIVIHINTSYTRGIEQKIVIEVKKEKVSMSGKTSYLIELDNAMKNRTSHYAIGAIHESVTPESVGVFRRYDGSKIICSIPEDDYPWSLEIAYVVARGELILSQQREELEIDPAQLLEKTNEIKAELEKIRSMKASLTGAKDKISDVYNGLGALEESIQTKINELKRIIKVE